ncbi:MAG TPA: DNA-binding protein WhiA [Candidatus Limnocylindria bacterium]|nr:DNA-binding protein WhiA [Candidatus Limnocylindria bacterium]
MSGARPERDLVAAIDAELAAVEPLRRCCRVAERAGLGIAARGRARSPAVGRLAVRLEAEVDGFDWPAAASHCRVAYLRGLFLARGSLSIGQAGTHLEFVVPEGELDELAARLTEVGLPARARVRRGRGVLTWKSADTILDFLRRAGATASTLELESRYVTRALHGHLNRVVNAEHANLRRSVEAARRQLAAIDVLTQSGRLARLPRRLRAVAEARRRAPEATFSELAAGLEASRAHVQRALEQIEQLALHAERRG